MERPLQGDLGIQQGAAQSLRWHPLSIRTSQPANIILGEEECAISVEMQKTSPPYLPIGAGRWNIPLPDPALIPRDSTGMYLATQPAKATGLPGKHILRWGGFLGETSGIPWCQPSTLSSVFYEVRAGASINHLCDGKEAAVICFGDRIILIISSFYTALFI